MTFTDRVLLRTLRFGPIGFVVLFLIAEFAGLFGGSGGALFTWIVLFPFVLLSIVGVNRVAAGRRRVPVSKRIVKSPSKPSFLNASCFLVGGLVGLLALGGLIVFAGLTDGRPSTWQKMVFAAAVLSGLGGMQYVLVIRPRLRYGGYLRGQSLIAKAKFAAAREAMLRNVAKRPHDAMAWIGAAWVHQIWHEEQEALKCAHRAVQLSPSVHSHLMRGQALARLGASEEALADLTAADRLKPEVGTNTLIGWVLTGQRRLDLALQYLEGAAGGANILGTTYLADTYRLAGHAEYARQTYRDLAATGRMCGKTGLPYIAYACAYLGEADKARLAAQQALTLNPRDILAMQALLVISLDDMDQAYRVAVAMALVSANAAVCALSQPEFAHLFADRRFRELFVACVRVRAQNIAAARRILATTGD